MSDVFLRAAKLDFESGEVVGRLVPFNEEAEVVDVHPDSGKVERFIEVFRHGSFAKMIDGLSSRGWTKAISLNLDHRSDVDGQIGYATAITEEPDGAWARFGLYESVNIEKVKSMLRSSHTGLSVGFIDRAHRTTGDLVERLRVHVAHVAATPTPSYAGATVASVRSMDFEDEETALEVVQLTRPRLADLKAELALVKARTFVQV